MKIASAEQESPSDVPLVRAWERGEATPIAEGMSRAFWLHRPAYGVSFWVKNTGGVYGGDVSRPLFFLGLQMALCKTQRFLNFTSTSHLPLASLRLSFVGSQTRRWMHMQGRG